MGTNSRNENSSREDKDEDPFIPLRDRKRLTKEEESTVATIQKMVRNDIFPFVKFLTGINNLEFHGRIAQRVFSLVENIKGEKTKRRWWGKYAWTIKRTMDTYRATAGHDLNVIWQGK